MDGVEDEDEFWDADDAPPPSSWSASPSSTLKPTAAAAGLGMKLLASIPLPATFSAAIGRPSAPSDPDPPRPPASRSGLGILLHPGPKPSADSFPVPDASAHNLPLPPTAALQQQHGEDEEVLEEQGATAQRAQLVLQHGEDHSIGHDVVVGGEPPVVLMEEEGRLTAEGCGKEGVADGRCSANRNVFSLQDQEEGERHTSDELGAAMEDQEVVEQEGAAKYHTAVEDQSTNSTEQCAHDAPRAINKDGNVVEEENKEMEQVGAVGIQLGAANNGVAVGSLEEEGVVVEGPGEDVISVQDQHKVVEQFTSEELEVAMGDSAFQDHELVVVEQEGVTEYYDAVVEDQSNDTAVELCIHDGLRAMKDDNGNGNTMKEKEKAMDQNGAIGILGAAKDGIAAESQEEEDVMVDGQGEGDNFVQDRHEVVDQRTSDELGALGDSAI